jgi:hypothetical protein
MGCSCLREGEVCLSNFCEGGACCAAPCELERAAEPAPLFGGDEPIGIRQAVWRSGDGLATCDGVCTSHALHEEHARPYEAEQRHDTPQQDMCATGGGVTYHTSQYEATFIIGVVVLVVLCTFAAYCKNYERQDKRCAQERDRIELLLLSSSFSRHGTAVGHRHVRATALRCHC